MMEVYIVFGERVSDKQHTVHSVFTDGSLPIIITLLTVLYSMTKLSDHGDDGVEFPDWLVCWTARVDWRLTERCQSWTRGDNQWQTVFKFSIVD